MSAPFHLRPPRRRLLAALACAAAIAATQPVQAADGTAAAAAQDFSAAERALFMRDQLHALVPPATLEYRFHRSGSLEAGFEDRVRIELEAKADGSCCRATGDFLSGERRMRLPEIEQAQGNPALLYFLEHDVREMQRLTQGQPAHFRKRIRMAIFRDAELRAARFDYRGRSIAGEEIRITPYVDDPARHRFARLADKEYVFMLSDEVPGGIYGIRTRTPAGGDETLLAEEILIDGASAAPASSLSTLVPAEPSR